MNAYSCASPIRFPVINAIAKGSYASVFSESNPKYRSGNSIVWGLIRGAKEIMLETKKAGYNFFHVDNAYFGRNAYYRVTLNALQLSQLPNKVIDNRYRVILSQLNKNILPWKTKRNGPIVLCPSSNFLYEFYESNLDFWIQNTISKIRYFTDRPIIIRHKELIPKDDIDSDISDAWCVVTHVSAAGLDALRLGIPVVTTGICASSPLATPIDKIDCPLLPDGREILFSYLAWGQFSLEEMLQNNIPDLVAHLQKE